MRRSHLLFAFPLLTLLGSAPDALAAPKAKGATAAKEEALPKIVPTGISEFDSVFMKARTIHDTLDVEDAKLKEARKGVTSVLEVAEDAPLETAFDELKKRANHKVKVALKGKMPRLEATDAVPDNVQQGIDAVNKLLDVGEHIIDIGGELEPEAQALGEACVDFPAKVVDMGLDPMKLLDASKKVTQDTKATVATKDRVQRLVKTSASIFDVVQKSFPGDGEPAAQPAE